MALNGTVLLNYEIHESHENNTKAGHREVLTWGSQNFAHGFSLESKKRLYSFPFGFRVVRVFRG